MLDLKRAVTEWLDKVPVDWTVDPDGAMDFDLDWGSSRYGCTVGVEGRTLVLCIAWHGTFASEWIQAASALTEFSSLARRGEVLLNHRTGAAVFRTAVDIDEHSGSADVARVLRLALDVFNVMILATRQIVGGAMTERQALEAFAATLPTLFERNERAGDKPPPDQRGHRNRITRYLDGDDDL